MNLCKLSFPKKDFRIKRKNLSVYNFFFKSKFIVIHFFLASCRNDPGYKNLSFGKEKFVQQTMSSWNVFWFETKKFCTLFSFFKSKFCCCSFFYSAFFSKYYKSFITRTDTIIFLVDNEMFLLKRWPRFRLLLRKGIHTFPEPFWLIRT